MKYFLIMLLLVCSTYQLKAQEKTSFYSNLKLIPVATFDLYHSVYDYSVGIAYERAFTKDNRFSWVLPVFFGAKKQENDGFVGKEDHKNMLKVNPGIKFYPFGQKTFTYGIGLSLFYLRGRREISMPSYSEISRMTQLGLMLHNSLSCNISKRLSLNLEIGYGPSIWNQFKDIKDQNNHYTPNILTMRHAHFSVGYRF